MTDKRIKSYLEDRLKRLESIRNEREWTTSELGDITCCKQTLAFVDSLQEEPVSEDLNIESMIESYEQRLISQANGMKNSPLIDMCLDSYKHGINETLDTLKLSNIERTVKNWKEPKFKVGDKIKFKGIHNEDVTRVITNIQKGDGDGFRYFFADGSIHSIGDDEIELVEEPVSEDLKTELNKYIKDHFTIDTEQLDRFGIEEKDYMYSMDKSDMLALVKHFTNWQKTKDESTTEDLGEYINELSKQFPEVSFAKLSRIAVRVAKWQKEHLWKPADGDDLPPIDKEVVVFTQDFPDDAGMMCVSIGHRPNPNGWDGKSLASGKVEHYTPKTYDKGGWNIPNVKYWLDCSLPNVED